MSTHAFSSVSQGLKKPFVMKTYNQTRYNRTFFKPSMAFHEILVAKWETISACFSLVDEFSKAGKT